MKQNANLIAIVRSSLSNARPGFRKIVGNLGWLFFDKALRVIVGLTVGVWVARFLGPHDFGVLSYALALVSIFGAVAGLGLDNIVVRDLVQTSDNKGVILGSSFVLRVLAGILSVLVCISFALVFHRDSALQQAIIILSGLLLLGSSDVIRNWFDSQVKSKYALLVGDLVLLLSAVARISLIQAEAEFMAFVWLILIESIFNAIGLFYIYSRYGGRLRQWAIEWTCLKSLLVESWPLMLSSVAIMIYMRTDQIMLAGLVDASSVGVYAAASRFSEMWHFLPMAVVASVFPAVIKAKQSGENVYINRLQNLYTGLVVCAMAITVPVFIFAETLAEFFYGSEFSGVGNVLRVQILSTVFVFLGVASGRWYILENLQKMALYRTLAGAVVNVVLNLLLIPRMGAVGAAVGTLASQFMAAYLFDLFSSRTMPSFKLKTEALLLLPFIRFRHYS